jgi:hypothetical protein
MRARDAKPFGKLPPTAWTIEDGTAARVFMFMVSTMNEQSECLWTQARIATEMGFASAKPVVRACLLLEALGWIVKERAKARRGNIYVVQAPPTKDPSQRMSRKGCLAKDPPKVQEGSLTDPGRVPREGHLLEYVPEEVPESSHARALSAFEQTKAAIANTPDTAAHYRWLLEAWNSTCAAKWGTPRASEAHHNPHQAKALNDAVAALTHESVQAALDTLVAKGHDHVTFSSLAKRNRDHVLRLTEIASGEDMGWLRPEGFKAPKAVSLPILEDVLDGKVPPSLLGYDKAHWEHIDLKPVGRVRYLELIEQHYPDAYAAWAAEAEAIITAAHERGVPRHDLRFEAREHSAHEAHREPICELFERAVAAVKEVA